MLMCAKKDLTAEGVRKPRLRYHVHHLPDRILASAVHMQTQPAQGPIRHRHDRIRRSKFPVGLSEFFKFLRDTYRFTIAAYPYIGIFQVFVFIPTIPEIIGAHAS
jgi:hypothetical protein